MKLAIPNRQAQIEVVPSASAGSSKPSKNRQETEEDGKKHSGNSTFDEVVSIDLNLEISETITEIQGPAQSVGGNVDGCLHRR